MEGIVQEGRETGKKIKEVTKYALTEEKMSVGAYFYINA